MFNIYNNEISLFDAVDRFRSLDKDEFILGEALDNYTEMHLSQRTIQEFLKDAQVLQDFDKAEYNNKVQPQKKSFSKQAYNLIENEKSTFENLLNAKVTSLWAKSFMESFDKHPEYLLLNESKNLDLISNIIEKLENKLLLLSRLFLDEKTPTNEDCNISTKIETDKDLVKFLAFFYYEEALESLSKLLDHCSKATEAS